MIFPAPKANTPKKIAFINDKGRQTAAPKRTKTNPAKPPRRFIRRRPKAFTGIKNHFQSPAGFGTASELWVLFRKNM
jgi:hypothetical protein